MQKKTLFLLLTAALSSLCFATNSASACSTIVVGKNASATGNILLGHNEDNDGRIITSQYWVPAADHQAGEMIEYEPDAAKIPQVPHTYGFYWTQTLHPAGYSYSDGFVNENGVAVASNQSYDTYDKDEAVHDGGVGYGIRRIVAERAKNARDGVNIAIELVKKYGYRAAGRVYTIADKDEAWQLNLIRGGRYIAKKVGDNEVVYVSNAYTLGPVDVKASDVLASDDLIQHAIDTGKYQPKKAGDFSDFNFREAYQTEARRDAEWIKSRSQTAWKILTGKEIQSSKDFPYSITPEKKLTVADVKKVLRGHYAYEKRGEFGHQSINDIGNLGTFDSTIYELTPDKHFTIGWRTSGIPSENPYVPFYPLAKPSVAQSFMSPEEATRQQFHAKPESFSYKPGYGLFVYLTNQTLTDYIGGRDKLSKEIGELEAEWDKDRKAVEARAKLIQRLDGNPKTLDYLHEFNAAAYDEATQMIAKQRQELHPADVLFLEGTLKNEGSQEAKVVVFGNKKFNAMKIDPKSILVTSGLPTEDIERIANPATAKSVVHEDVNKDGYPDAVITFDAKFATQLTGPGSSEEIYVFGKANGKKFGGFDVVKIEK